LTEGRAIVLAGAAHLALLAGLSLSWSLMSKDIPPIVEPIPIDFVDISDVPTVDRRPEPSIEAAPRETVEEAALPEPEPEPVVEETPPADVASKVAPPPKAKPAEKPKPQPKPKRDLSNLVDKSLADAPRRTRPSDFAKVIEDAIPEGARLDARTSATLAQAIRERIYRCWNPNAGGPDARSIATLLRVRVARDGAIIGRPDVVAQTGITSANAGYGRVMRDSAIRAVMNPACSLAGLPPELYDGWKEFELNFDPEEML
jgi:outer membrane biosynthesis protein TonB